MYKSLLAILVRYVISEDNANKLYVNIIIGGRLSLHDIIMRKEQVLLIDIPAQIQTAGLAGE